MLERFRACLAGSRWPADPADPAIALGLLARSVGLGVAYPYTEHVRLWVGPIWLSIQAAWLACILASTALFLRAPCPTASTRSPDALTHVATVIAGVALIWLAHATAGVTS